MRSTESPRVLSMRAPSGATGMKRQGRKYRWMSTSQRTPLPGRRWSWRPARRGSRRRGRRGAHRPAPVAVGGGARAPRARRRAPANGSECVMPRWPKGCGYGIPTMNATKSASGSTDSADRPSIESASAGASGREVRQRAAAAPTATCPRVAIRRTAQPASPDRARPRSSRSIRPSSARRSNRPPVASDSEKSCSSTQRETRSSTGRSRSVMPVSW